MFFKRLIVIVTYWLGYIIGFVTVSLKWSPWSPWTIAKLNMAWKHYISTPMYEGRVAFDKELKDRHGADYKGNFPIQAFVDNREYLFFTNHITRKEWLKIIFTPFSCEDIFQFPAWKIKEWWHGGTK